jgi:hypothetical protein
MSDAVTISLITSITSILVLVLNHKLGQRDRTLASETVMAKDKEIGELRSTWEIKERSYQETIATLTRKLLDMGVTP